MILVMAYALLLSACLAAGAAALEPLCRALRVPTRWVWCAALGLMVTATAAALWLPSTPDAPAPAREQSVVVPVSIAEVPGDADQRSPIWHQAGAVAAVGWIGGTLLLLVGLAAAARRLARERALADRSQLQGHDVFLTDGVGPAVAGVWNPVALIPRWVLELDEGAQRLLVAHEMEHVRARDNAVLASGALAVTLLPWNPLAWWALRRLRLAVEVDCDRRVLSRGTAVRRYAELLLMTARMPSAHPRLLAASLGEGDSDLERRIIAMTEGTPIARRPLLARVLLPATLSAGLVLIACETPRPEPVGPTLPLAGSDNGARAITDEIPLVDRFGRGMLSADVCAPDASAGGKQVLAACAALHDSLATLYRRLLASADSVEQVVQIEPKRMDESERPVLRRLRESGDQREQEIQIEPKRIDKSAGGVPLLREVPANEPPREPPVEAVVESKRLAFPTDQRAPGGSEQPVVVRRSLSDVFGTTSQLSVVVKALDGRELARDRTNAGEKSRLLERIRPEDIAVIEVYKGQACEPLRCPLVTITLKQGSSIAKD